jgi:hypothetical protein
VHANEVPTEADNTLRTAIANASASLILVDIVILHTSKREVASADWIAKRDGLFRQSENYCSP